MSEPEDTETLSDAIKAAKARLEKSLERAMTLLYILDNIDDPYVQVGLDPIALLKDAHVLSSNFECMLPPLKSTSFYKPH